MYQRLISRSSPTPALRRYTDARTPHHFSPPRQQCRSSADTKFPIPTLTEMYTTDRKFDVSLRDKMRCASQMRYLVPGKYEDAKIVDRSGDAGVMKVREWLPGRVELHCRCVAHRKTCYTLTEVEQMAVCLASLLTDIMLSFPSSLLATHILVIVDETLKTAGACPSHTCVA